MPDWKPQIRKRLAKLNLAGAREAEIVDELAQHAEDRYRELLAGGASDAEARRAAMQELGSKAFLASELQATERPQSAAVSGNRQGRFLAGFLQDIRYGIRNLQAAPGFTTVAILALAIGIGANTAIFSVVNGVLLQPLSYPDPGRLLTVYEGGSDYIFGSVAYPNFLDWRSESTSFTGMGAFRNDRFNFTGTGEPEQLAGEYISASVFPILGVHARLGRNFLPREDRQGAACAVMLSDNFWKRRYGADVGVLGKVLTLNAVNCSVIGVTSPGMIFAPKADIYLPIEQYAGVEFRTRDAHMGMNVVARLKPAVSAETAKAELAAICRRLAIEYPKTNAGHGVNLVPLKDDLVGSIRPTLLLLVGAVGFVLIIACANVANLLLARSTTRRREFAIRTALGANRGRVVRQLLTESLLISLGGALAGLLLAQWATPLVLAAAPADLPRAESVGIDGYVLLFTLAVSVVTGILFGLVPAFQGANTNPQQYLKEGTRGAGGGKRRAEGVFVVVEVGLAVILLSGAGLMMQSLWRLWRIDPGFDTHHILAAEVALSPTVVGSGPKIRQAFDQIVERVETTPGIRAAAITSMVPLDASNSENEFWLGSGPQPAPEQMRAAMFSIITPDYRAVMQFPLLKGRSFNKRDSLGTSPVILIDDVMARNVFAGQDPVGKQISMSEIGPLTIVGVVGHVKHWGLDSDDTATIRNQVYFPFGQVPDMFMTEAVAGLTLIARTEGEPLAMASAVSAQVAGPTRDQPLHGVRSMEQIISRGLARRRFTMLVLIIFASTALLLAAVGIYGVMSYAVTRQTHEIGIRAALGATRWEIIALVLRYGLKLAAMGLAGGLVAALALTRLMAGLLYGVRPADPATLAAVALLLAAVAALACYIPARRATAVDPATALHCE